MVEAESVAGAVQRIRNDFRRQLEVFYTGVKLAPPYHSIEQAVATLAARLKAMAPDERARLSADRTLLWREYHHAFVESGLSQKHRGIIRGLIQANRITGLPTEHEHFLTAYLT